MAKGNGCSRVRVTHWLPSRSAALEGSQLRWFYRLLGAALAARLWTDEQSGIWRVHTGELFPWRHLPGVPLYSTWVLMIEWAALALAALGLLSGLQRRASLYLGLVAMLMGLSQRYANQNVLLLLILVFATLRFLSPPGPATSELDFPNFGLIRWQLWIVYGFSIANKLAHGFLSGDAIDALFGAGAVLSQRAAFGVIAGEALVPILLCSGNARLGFCAAVLLHGMFALTMPGMWPFSFAMLAMAALFVQSAGSTGSAHRARSASRQRVMEKLGMRRVKVRLNDRIGRDGEPFDQVVYEIDHGQ